MGLPWAMLLLGVAQAQLSVHTMGTVDELQPIAPEEPASKSKKDCIVGEFDPVFYRKNNEDISWETTGGISDRLSQISAEQIFAQWLSHGARQGRIGCEGCCPGKVSTKCENGAFDWQFYIKQYPELGLTSQAEAVHHWRTVGKVEGFSGCALCCAVEDRDAEADPPAGPAGPPGPDLDEGQPSLADQEHLAKEGSAAYIACPPGSTIHIMWAQLENCPSGSTPSAEVMEVNVSACQGQETCQLSAAALSPTCPQGDLRMGFTCDGTAFETPLVTWAPRAGRQYTPPPKTPSSGIGQSSLGWAVTAGSIGLGACGLLITTALLGVHCCSSRRHTGSQAQSVHGSHHWNPMTPPNVGGGMTGEGPITVLCHLGGEEGQPNTARALPNGPVLWQRGSISSQGESDSDFTGKGDTGGPVVLLGAPEPSTSA
mmetsp:Transcript_10017/g.11399  ORF Transcript_10017/g.11399 Transcript_10017/m.11399 type:complete len:428 (+) Transcript_10017:37-1320(+)|eukprot:CAMPEP_0205822354 /NCGR_PEP_ID=MMETSP0206-20130828/12123_1 /ASSEMBLY_ACC=CAM_ASM_000279 /TAXON_ID=36767 /ORGANISM="Euplotes focardii, Strain TN1" /LENGTH=427 /DNA_ID=CAMNT_0053118557 /DNA_START=31 /DNA_END=1314 /DNA_ORIENTATION=+